MNCPKCGYERAPDTLECPKCGIVFRKYERARQACGTQAEKPSEGGPHGGMLHCVLLHVPERPSAAAVALRGALLALLFIWGWKFILCAPHTNAAGNSFLHLVNLPFHEAGHVFFGLLGRFIGALGGTLGQLLMPLICMAVLLLRQRDPFGASVALWWFGQNFIDIAPYINDARAGVLPLLGGNTGDSSPYGFHDWRFILTELKLVKYDHALAYASHAVGALVLLASSAWGAAVLNKQYQKRS